MHELAVGTILQKGKYIIESVLGQGSFGITYLATTKMHGPLGEISVKVALKEFFARDLNTRHQNGSVCESGSGSLSDKYSKDFLRESRNLSRLSHRGIIRIFDSFQENNTHYYVMEYLDGGSLDAYIQSKGHLGESETLVIAGQIAEALSFMHSNKMLHLDLKPKNVMRRSDGSICLIDFGLSKQYESSGEPESSTTIGLGTPGYAPLEQGSTDERKNFAPTLDVYALGGTMFKMLTGKTPPRASDIMNEGFPSAELSAFGVSSKTLSLIACMMSPRRKERPQSIADCGLTSAKPKRMKQVNTEDTRVFDEETVSYSSVRDSNRKGNLEVRTKSGTKHRYLEIRDEVKCVFLKYVPSENGLKHSNVPPYHLKVTPREMEMLGRNCVMSLSKKQYLKILNDINSLYVKIRDNEIPCAKELVESSVKLEILCFTERNYRKYWVYANESGICGNVAEDVFDVSRRLYNVLPDITWVDVRKGKDNLNVSDVSAVKQENQCANKAIDSATMATIVEIIVLIAIIAAILLWKI